MIGTSMDIGRIDQPSLIVAERIMVESSRVNNYFIEFLYKPMNPWYIKERILWTRLYTFAPREFVFQREDTLIVENIYKAISCFIP